MKTTYFTNAPGNWEILQQTNGQATYTFTGHYEIQPNTEPEHNIIYVGVLDEVNGAPVVTFQPAEMAEGEFTFTCTIPAGGLYRIELRIATKPYMSPTNATPCDARHHIGVGDNYIVAGQSNASGVGKGEIEEPLDLMVHTLRDREYWDIATNPMDFGRTLNTPWVAFARVLARHLHYPIGLIPTAIAGSLIKSWLPEESGELYQTMISVVREHKIGVKGIIWYQGCSEALMCEGDSYFRRLSSFISHAREDLNQPNLPIHIMQINRRMDGGATPELHHNWSLVREAQRKASHDIPNVTLTPAFDARLSDGIHNGAITNPALGQRMAMQVLYTNYHIGTNHNPPDIEVAEQIEDTHIRLTFTNTYTMQLFALGDRTPLMVEDSQGKVPFTSVTSYGPYVSIKLARKIEGPAFVSCMYGEELPYFIADSTTQIPALAFYRVPVA